MKTIVNYIIGITLVVLSTLIFRVDNSAVYSLNKNVTNDREQVFSFSMLSSHNDVVIPENIVSATSNIQNITPNNLLYRPYFTKEQSDYTILQCDCKSTMNLFKLHKPQSSYYVYTLHKIRI